MKNSSRLLTLTFVLAIALSVASCTMADRSAPGNSPDSHGAEGRVSVNELPGIPWEGGPDYWKQFPKTEKAGWANESFFPIVLWYNGISTNEEAQYDKKLGFNSYIGMAETTPYRLFDDNGVYWIGPPLNESFTSESRNWAGNFLGDEVDGRFTPEEGKHVLEKAKADLAGSGRFNYANFTQIVMGRDMKSTDSEAFVNDYSDVASIDMYWYTVPFCDWQPSPIEYLTPVTPANCRTASSYGKTMQSLRLRDEVDGKLQPLWQFVELLNGGPGDDQAFVANITPGQLQGAVMNSLIHEARGIVYFNQSLNGDCTGGSLVRQTMMDPQFCAKEQVAAAGEINNRIHDLAPVINSQSLDYDFGPGLATMLKIKDGYAYIFSMIDDNPDPGSRTLTLPPDLSGRSIQVLYEDRTLASDAHGSFSDVFKDEYSYHIYKVEL